MKYKYLIVLNTTVCVTEDTIFYTNNNLFFPRNYIDNLDIKQYLKISLI